MLVLVNKSNMSIKKFSLVGLLNTFLGLFIIFLAKWVGLGDIISNLTGYACGIILSFSLNSRWSFNYEGDQLRAFIIFVIITVLAYLVNLVTVLLLINLLYINSYLAQSLGILPYFLISYNGSKYFAFSK